MFDMQVNATVTAPRGVYAPPRFDPADAATILADLDQAATVRLTDLRSRLGFSQDVQNNLITEGLLEAEHVPGRGAPYVTSPDEARTLLLAVVLAVAAGVALAIMMRGVKGAGLTGALAAELLRDLAAPPT